MRRLLVLLVAVGVLAAAPGAGAHPLGNFTVNHLTEVSISRDQVSLTYILDRAEVPTFQLRDESEAELLSGVGEEVVDGLSVDVGGERVPLRLRGPGTVVFAEGQGGLQTSRFEVSAVAAAPGATRVVVRDETYADRLGLRAIIARPGEGTAVDSSVPAQDATNGLRAYPRSVIVRPPDQRSAAFAVAPGAGTLKAPDAEFAIEKGATEGQDGLAGVFERAADGEGVLLFLLLAALAWGAMHALSPGHGKAMVAAYLVGARGTPRDALLLGGVVTVTHTIGVFALGVVTLLLAQYILPEDLYPWLTLLSGAMVVAIGIAVLRARWPGRAPAAAHHHRHHHPHHHDHNHDHDHHHGGHSHTHAVPERLTGRNLVAMGASAGLIPCPSALVVLLGAIAQHQVLLGLGLILAFSVGLAATLAVLGLVVVLARDRLAARSFGGGRAAAALPALSAVVIVVAGCALTVQAIPQVV